MRGDVRFVLGMPPGRLLRIDELIVDRDFEDTPGTGDETHVVALAELLEDLLCRAHGTGGVVSGSAELDGHVGHAARLGDAWRGAGMRSRSAVLEPDTQVDASLAVSAFLCQRGRRLRAEPDRSGRALTQERSSIRALLESLPPDPEWASLCSWVVTTARLRLDQEVSPQLRRPKNIGRNGGPASTAAPNMLHS